VGFYAKHALPRLIDFAMRMSRDFARRGSPSSRKRVSLNRKVDELITNAGFQINDLKTFYLPGPRPMTYTYQGLARGVINPSSGNTPAVL
jgi:hypothetical protein